MEPGPFDEWRRRHSVRWPRVAAAACCMPAQAAASGGCVARQIAPPPVPRRPPPPTHSPSPPARRPPDPHPTTLVIKPQTPQPGAGGYPGAQLLLLRGAGGGGGRAGGVRGSAGGYLQHRWEGPRPPRCARARAFGRARFRARALSGARCRLLAVGSWLMRHARVGAGVQHLVPSCIETSYPLRVPPSRLVKSGTPPVMPPFPEVAPMPDRAPIASAPCQPAASHSNTIPGFPPQSGTAPVMPPFPEVGPMLDRALNSTARELLTTLVRRVYEHAWRARASPRWAWKVLKSWRCAAGPKFVSHLVCAGRRRGGGRHCADDVKPRSLPTACARRTGSTSTH